MTLEIIVFIFSILFGIICYWRESKSNKLYRLANKVTHSKALQMKPESKKGFVHEQPFILRLVWITVLFALAAAIITFVTPINVFFVQYFASAIVGTLLGTYLASALLFAQRSTSKENLEKVFDKGKEFVADLTEGVAEEKTEQNAEEITKQEEVAPEKSARDRLKDKGMIQ